MTDIRRVGDSGIHTIEGNIAGDLAAQFTKQREKQQQEYEQLKNKIKENNKTVIGQINDKFSSAIDSGEQEFRRKTIGLVTAEEFRKASQEADQAQKLFDEQQLQQKEAQFEKDRKNEAAKAKERQLKRKKALSALSFANDEEENGDEDEEDGPLLKTRRTKKDLDGEQKEENNSERKIITLKNPNVDTSFLPDPRREKELELQREKLKKEWLEEQERIKTEKLEVTYSYWDGSGHRHVVEVTKGMTIGKFLEKVKHQLAKEFTELRSCAVEDLLYVKEDLIIPQHFSFYDLIITKARGKSGPLFHFDVHEDVRLRGDARVEKDESHPGKVCERRWYERNKHIFPASRWEIYDPSISRDQQKYTIHGDEVKKK